MLRLTAMLESRAAKKPRKFTGWVAMRRTVKLKLRSELREYFLRSKTEVRIEGILISQVLLSFMPYLQRTRTRDLLSVFELIRIN